MKKVQSLVTILVLVSLWLEGCDEPSEATEASKAVKTPTRLQHESDDIEAPAGKADTPSVELELRIRVHKGKVTIGTLTKPKQEQGSAQTTSEPGIGEVVVEEQSIDNPSD